MPPGAAAAAAGHTAGPEPSSTDRPFAPDALPGPDILTLPETVRYRLKNALLGPPLATERQTVERLGKIAGLGVLAPDMISSSAYGTEEMLTQLVPWFGVAAFALVGARDARHLGHPRLRHALVPRGDQGVYESGRIVRCRPRQFRSPDRTGGGGGAAHRLHGHGRRAVYGRYRRAHLARPEARPLHRAGNGRGDHHPVLRQPARHPRGGEDVRPADLSVHPRTRVGDRRRNDPRSAW